MTKAENRATDPDETGYGAAREGDREEMPDQEQQHRREPPSDEEAEQDNYANTDDAPS
jgi:hypothetical protein